MVELIDTPTFHNRRAKRRWTPWVLLATGLLLLTAMAWGQGNYVPMGSINGLEAGVLFLNYEKVSPNGEFVYSKAKPIDYQILVKNRGNSSFNRVEMGASLHSDGLNCSEGSLSTGHRLPGKSVTPYHTASLAPGQTYLIEGTYEIPASLCDGSGHVQLRLQMEQRGTLKAQTVVSPVHFHIE